MLQFHMEMKLSKKSKKKTEDFDFNDLSQKDQQEMISGLEEQMREAAKKLDFEEAARLRDTVLELKAEIEWKRGKKLGVDKIIIHGAREHNF